MTDVAVTATRSENAWTLAFPERDWAPLSVKSLERAEGTVREHLGTIAPDVDPSTWQIAITPDIGPLSAEVAAARQAGKDAAAAQERAARQIRTVVRALSEAGFSNVAIAGMLEVSRSRVSQLMKD